MQTATNIGTDYVVITPVGNETEFVGGRIDSMVAQSVQPNQWIIVEDGSIGKTAAIIQEWSTNHPGLVRVRQPGGH